MLELTIFFDFHVESRNPKTKVFLESFCFSYEKFEVVENDMCWPSFTVHYQPFRKNRLLYTFFYEIKILFLALLGNSLASFLKNLNAACISLAKHLRRVWTRVTL